MLFLFNILISILGMALGLGESDKTTAKQILKRRQLPLKDFEQKTGILIKCYNLHINNKSYEIF